MKVREISRHLFGIFLSLQALALAAGNYVGWSTILREVKVFCGNEGRGFWSLTDFTGTFTRNPLLTPCFWGSVAFAVALIWTLRLLRLKDRQKQLAELRKLWWLLLGGTLFALVNNVPVIYRFYTQPETVTSCSPDRVLTNPFATSCFLGFAAFLAAFICASLARRYLKR